MFEYNMVLKQAPFQIEQKLLYKIYGLLSAPIGTNESIQKVDKNDVLSGFNKYYTPQNLQIVVLGISEKMGKISKSYWVEFCSYQASWSQKK